MYVKLFGSILDSSIWEADLGTRVVWITMLAMADEYGIVYASVGGLARRAQVSAKVCRNALKSLASPDTDSRTKTADGRRIEHLDGGWRLINYSKYRELRTRKQVADAMRQARHRHPDRDVSQAPVTGHDVTTEAEAEAEADTEGETTKSKAIVAQSATGESLIAELKTLATTSKGNGVSRETRIKLIFAYWAARWDHAKTCLDVKRKACLRRRLQENGDNVSELLFVVDGSKRDDWAERPKFAGIEQLFRDRGAVEKFAQMSPDYVGGAAHPMAVKYGFET